LRDLRTRCGRSREVLGAVVDGGGAVVSPGARAAAGVRRGGRSVGAAGGYLCVEEGYAGIEEDAPGAVGVEHGIVAGMAAAAAIARKGRTGRA